MRRHLGLAFCLSAVLAPARLAGQWGVEVELGTSRFSGTARDTSASGPARSGPSHPTSVALRLDRRFGRAGVAVGVLYASAGIVEENDVFAVLQKDVLTLVELAPEVSWRFAQTARGAGFRLHVGPVADIWQPDGGTSRALAGAHAGLSLEWPIGERLHGSVRAAGVVTGPVFTSGDLPAGFERRATWRRSLSLGLRYRL